MWVRADNQQTEINQLITAAEARQFEQAFEQAAGIKDTRETGTNAYRPGTCVETWERVWERA